MNNLNWQNGNLVDKVKRLKNDLDEIQMKIDKNPYDKLHRENGVAVLKDYSIALEDEEKLVFQRAKNDKECMDLDPSIFLNQINPQDAYAMVGDISNDEIKAAMFSIDDNKALGPDGYTVKFYKKAWHIIGTDVCNAVKEFFCEGDVGSVKVVKQALDEFSCASRIYFNLGKSTILCGNMDRVTIENILAFLPFKRGKLPVRYLGVPLVAKKIGIKDYESLIDKSVTKDIERIFKAFLWNHGELHKGKAKVAWKEVCQPKQNGGLGFKPIEQWNNALLVKHLWNVAAKKDSLWVRWINVVKLKVADCVQNNNWSWPEDWFIRYPILSQYQVPKINADIQDKLLWCSNNGTTTEFSSNQVWKDMRILNDEIKGWKVIWFSQNVPRHAFVLWMTSKGKLVTQDKLAMWYPSKYWKCPLCMQVKDSHKHLLCMCVTINYVWRQVNHMAYVNKHVNVLDECMMQLSKLPCKNSIWSIVRRLCIADTVYHLWIERNSRLFHQHEKSSINILKQILGSVSSRLMTLRVKSSSAVKEVEVK
ncbi:RNA-directed DNA polymerase, eukaryota, reverse transcriptase zinc-binding domain protein [Tanacetum coccineum]